MVPPTDFVTATQVTAIHNKLPAGGILVFVTGQREVDSLVRKLQHSLAPKKTRSAVVDPAEVRGPC